VCISIRSYPTVPVVSKEEGLIDNRETSKENVSLRVEEEAVREE